MKVVLDGRLISDFETGISKYSRELIKIYQEYYGYENVLVIINNKLKNKKGFKNIETNLNPFRIKDFVRFHKFLEKIDASIYHSFFYSNSLKKDRTKKYITTVHDLMYLEVESFFGKDLLKNFIGKKYFNFIVSNSLKNSDIIISVSKTTQKDLKKYFKKESEVIVEGTNKISLKEKSVKNLINKSYFLYVGNSRPHKNLEFLLSCFLKAKTEKKLVLVGTNNKIKINSPNILTLGYMEDNELNWLYKNCEAFIFPSLYEGFGLPILEALSKGAKVFSSNKGSLGEFSEKAVYFFNPMEEAELIKLLETSKNLENNILEVKKELEKYTWEVTKRDMVKIFNKIKE